LKSKCAFKNILRFSTLIILLSGIDSLGMDHSMATSLSTKNQGETLQEMPMAKKKRIYTVTGEEDFEAVSGFGANDSMAGMMNLMMVEGSGIENMEMAPMKAQETDSVALENVTDKKALERKSISQNLSMKVVVEPKKPIMGTNKLNIRVTDQNGKPMMGLKLKAIVAMASMDMGTTTPKVRELESGNYEVETRFLMQGPWRVTITSQNKEGIETFKNDFIFEAGAQKPWIQK
jgi:nitrogen fixation protein FixH